MRNSIYQNIKRWCAIVYCAVCTAVDLFVCSLRNWFNSVLLAGLPCDNSTNSNNTSSHIYSLPCYSHGHFSIIIKPKMTTNLFSSRTHFYCNTKRTKNHSKLLMRKKLKLRLICIYA